MKLLNHDEVKNNNFNIQKRFNNNHIYQQTFICIIILCI